MNRNQLLKTPYPDLSLTVEKHLKQLYHLAPPPYAEQDNALKELETFTRLIGQLVDLVDFAGLVAPQEYDAYVEARKLIGKPIV